VCFGSLLASSNWNNSDKAGIGYLNANNEASKSNRNISTRLELRSFALEQTALNSILTSTKK
jgi:hypothetical protein